MIRPAVGTKELETASLCSSIETNNFLPASVIVLLNSSRKMLRTWRAPASPYIRIQERHLE